MATKTMTAAEAISQRVAAAAPQKTEEEPAVKPVSSLASVELEPEVPVESVKLDGLAVMKIIKHSREAALLASSSSAAGQLLGLDSSGVLNISDAFPLPAGSLSGGGEGEESRGAKAALRYTQAVLPRLSALGSDANLVGFYVSTYHGQHLATPGFLDALIAIQLGAPSASASARVQASSVTRSARAPPLAQASKGSSQGGKGVAIVYDLASASQGTVDLKAFKLSQAFVDAHRAGRFDSQSLTDHKLTHSNILEEVPLKVQSSAILTAFLSTIIAPPSSSSRSATSRAPSSTASYAPLGLPSSSDPDAPAPLTDTLSALISSLETHNAALSTLSFQSRQLGRDRARLEAMVAKRKSDNEIRSQQGLPPLAPSAEEAALQEPSRLETMCALSGVEGAAESLSEVTGTGLVRAYGAHTGIAA